jgi:hypothetical protein
MVHAKESPLKCRVHEASISPSVLASEVFDNAPRRHGTGRGSTSEPVEVLLASASDESEAVSKALNDIVDPKTTSKSTARVKARVLAADGRGELWPISAIVMAGSKT